MPYCWMTKVERGGSVCGSVEVFSWIDERRIRVNDSRQGKRVD